MNLRRMLSFQPFAPAVFLAGCALVLIVVAIIIMTIMNGAREAAQTKVDAEMGNARAKTAAVAGQVIDRAHADATASEDLTRKNADAIDNAPGAGQRLDPAFSDTVRRRVCERASYRRTPDCLQLLGPVQPSR